MAQNYFKRTEKKYILNRFEYEQILQAMKSRMQPDKYFRSNISNVYFDTEHNDLIIESLEKPDYKYKVRVRSYGEASKGYIFFEIKSKLLGVVYKRRVQMTLNEYEAYLQGEYISDNQVLKELDYLFKTKSLLPKIFIAYDRLSYKDTEGSDLRITFDQNLRSLSGHTSIDEPEISEQFFDTENYIMEIKTYRSMPLWLTNLLSKNHIYPTSFSKYGQIYQRLAQMEASHAY